MILYGQDKLLGSPFDLNDSVSYTPAASDCEGVRYEPQKPPPDDFVLSWARRVFSVDGADGMGAGRFLQG